MIAPNVVDMAEARRAKAQRAAIHKPAPLSEASSYWCLRCEGEDFRLYERGDVHCVACGAWMRNLTVSMQSPS